MLRNNLYTHVTDIFPRHDELIKRYASAAYYLTVHGVDEHGIIVGSRRPLNTMMTMLLMRKLVKDPSQATRVARHLREF